MLRPLLSVRRCWAVPDDARLKSSEKKCVHSSQESFNHLTTIKCTERLLLGGGWGCCRRGAPGLITLWGKQALNWSLFGIGSLRLLTPQLLNLRFPAILVHTQRQRQIMWHVLGRTHERSPTSRSVSVLLISFPLVFFSRVVCSGPVPRWLHQMLNMWSEGTEQLGVWAYCE